MQIIHRTHALERMFQRKIQSSEVRAVLENGETIEDYPMNTPYPSRLILGWSSNRPIHVVADYAAEAYEWIVITVYLPDPTLWSDGYRWRLP